jgi:hypothetical protein
MSKEREREREREREKVEETTLSEKKESLQKNRIWWV